MNMSSFIYNKNQVNWTSTTKVIASLVKAVRFHRHTGHPNVSLTYTSLELEFDSPKTRKF